MSLESQRLTYEQITRNHAKELELVLCDPIVYRHISDGLTPTFDELLASFILLENGSSPERSNETWVNYVVRLKNSDVAIGRVEATVIDRRAEVAYLLGASYWRQGYGNESFVWLQNFLQQKYNISEFWATVTPGNEASKQLLLKNGYVEADNNFLPRLSSYDENDWVFFRTVTA
jgi:[ribosomal protein S5]-alanine N-acetyltransferase